MRLLCSIASVYLQLQYVVSIFVIVYFASLYWMYGPDGTLWLPIMIGIAGIVLGLLGIALAWCALRVVDQPYRWFRVFCNMVSVFWLLAIPVGPYVAFLLRKWSFDENAPTKEST